MSPAGFLMSQNWNKEFWVNGPSHFSFKNWGFYSKKLENTNLSIFSLNMLACHPRNWELYKSDSDPGGQLAELAEFLGNT